VMTTWKEMIAQQQTGAPPYKPTPTPLYRPPPKGSCSNPAALVTRQMTMMDHALDWAGRGLHVFPCEMFLGLPRVTSWYKNATTDTGAIAQWWSDDPTYDIAAVPAKSGHYCIVVTGETGRESLAQFEMEHGVLKPAFRYRTHWKAEHLWFKGNAHSAHIDDGLYLVGTGQYVYLAPSRHPTLWHGADNGRSDPRRYYNTADRGV
jgi:hypothetical protein